METMATTIATAKPEASKPFNKRDLVAALAEQHHLSKRASQKVLDGLIGLITKPLEERRAGQDHWARRPASAQARRPHGPQSCDWRGDQD